MGTRKNLFGLCFSWLRGGNGGSDPRDRARLASLQAENDRLTAELRELERHLDLIERRHEAELAGRNEAPSPAGRGLRIPVEVAIGELIDKRTILEIKLERITDPVKRGNIAAECDVVTAAAAQFADNPPLQELTASLKAVNLQIWDAEDEIRVYERTKNFGESFIALARSIHAANDRRAALKRRINESAGSGLLEEKSYPI